MVPSRASLAHGARHLRGFAAYVWERFNEDRCLQAAASLSYTSLLALVPLTVIGFAVMSAFPVFDDIQQDLQSFVFGTFLPSAIQSVQEYIRGFVGKAQGLTALGVIGLAIVAFTLFYLIIPNRPVRISHALIGGVVAGLAFGLLRAGFAAYVARFPAYQTLYGALSVVPMFLVWLYLSWAVVLAGAVLTAALPAWGRGDHVAGAILSPGAKLMLALRIMAKLYDASQRGGGVKRRDLLPLGHSDSAVDTMLTDLRRARFVDVTSNGRWMAARDANATSLGNLGAALGLSFGVQQLPTGDAGPGWAPRVAAVLKEAAEANDGRLAVTLRELLLTEDDEPAKRGERPPAEALPLRRSP